MKTLKITEGTHQKLKVLQAKNRIISLDKTISFLHSFYNYNK